MLGAILQGVKARVKHDDRGRIVVERVHLHIYAQHATERAGDMCETGSLTRKTNSLTSYG